MTEEELAKSSLLALLENSPTREPVKAGLLILFPKITPWLSEGYSRNGDRRPALNRRIANSHFASSYFKLSVDRSIWSKSEFDAALQRTPDDAFLVLESHLTARRGEDDYFVRDVFIDTVFDVLKDAANSQQWFASISKNYSLLVRREDVNRAPFFGLSIPDRVRVLMVRALEKIDRDLQPTVFQDALSNTDDMSLLTSLFRGIAGDSLEDGAKPSYSAVQWDTKTANAVRSTVVDRVERIVGEGKFWEQVDPAGVLWFWRNAGSISEVRDFTTSQMQTSTGLDGLFNATISYVLSSAGNYERVDQAAWSKLLDLERLRQLALELASDDTSQSKQMAIRFLHALEKGTSDDV